MILNKYFTKAYCINLDRRQDRWEKSIKLFEKFNINVERFSAFDGKTLKLSYPHSSELGGTISHMNVLKTAKELNLPNVLIFEDDVILDDNIGDKFSNIISQIPSEWDMLYFGGNHEGGFSQVSENIVKINHTYALQMYAVNAKCYDTIIDFLQDRIDKVINGNVTPKPSVAADFFIALLQPSINCYCIRPHLSWQSQDFSDIQERVVNYDYLLKN
jgi:GR25 family glycosyltransferase involved in LPS biosynthesis